MDPIATPLCERPPLAQVQTRVRRLAVRDFRNYQRAALAPDAGVVVLYGANGAGKTNLLEALSLLAPGRGLRGARLAQLDRRDGGAFHIQAEIRTAEGLEDVAIAHERAGRRRVVRFADGVPRPAGALARLPGILWATPEMDRLFADAPAARRRFLDRLVLALDGRHADRVAAYERALRERAHLLRSGCRDEAWLAVLERRMAETAVAVAAARRELVAILGRELAHSRAGFPAARLGLRGEIEEALEGRSAIAVEDWMCEELRRARPVDAESGGASVGPHRSDLQVATAAGEPAGSCSTGGQKALLLAMLLAQTRIVRAYAGSAPILLLDEATAHLDPARRAALFETLVELEGQAWVSGTERSLFRELEGRARFFRIHEAKLYEE